jgi:undecaprenyl-diphosphatase
VIIATIPTGIIGLFFKDKVEQFHSNLKIVGICFLITALLLAITYFLNKHYKGKPLLSMPYYVPFLIGVVQGLAVMPGISRSGSTIVIALLLGVTAKEATSFSFLISIPAITGAFILQLFDISGNLLSINYIAGGIAAFITGVFSIKLVVQLVENSKLYFFSLYLVIIGIISFLI